MARGAHAANLGRVRGWVPGYCGPDGPDKHFVGCGIDYDSIYCPVLTPCNAQGALYASLWVAGWDRGENAKIMASGFLGGATGLSPAPIPDNDIMAYFGIGKKQGEEKDEQSNQNAGNGTT